MTWLSQCVRVRVLSKGVSFERRWYQFDVGIYPRKLAEVGIVGIFWCLRWHSPRVKCFVFFLSLLFVALYKDSSDAAAIASASCSSGCWHRWHLFALVGSPGSTVWCCIAGSCGGAAAWPCKLPSRPK